MRFIAVLWFSTCCVLAGWVTNTTMPSTTTNSALLLANNFELANMFTGTNGDVHVVMVYDVLSDLYQPLQIFDVNITQNTGRLTNAVGTSGRTIAYGAAFLDGWFYRGTSDGINAKSQIFRYHPVSGEVQCLRTNTQKTFYSMAIADDDRLVFGSFGSGGVDRYDPSDGTWENFGNADTNYAGSSQYAYTIGADSRYIYVGLGQSPWYLAVIDTQTGAHWTYWSNETYTASGVYKGVNGGWYYLQGGGSFYQLIGGVPVETNAVSLIAYYRTNNNVVVDENDFTSTSGKDFDFGFAYPDSSNNVSTLRYAPTGTTDWDTVSATNFNLAAANLKRVYNNGSGSLFVLPNGYMPVLSHLPASGTTTILGRHGSSLYDAIKNGVNWYLSGYASISYKYDSGSTWNLSPTTEDKTVEGINPRAFSGSVGKYHYYSAFGSDGYLYVGGHHERDSVGGELGWFNVSTMAKVSSYRPTTWTYSTNDVSDVKAAANGTKIVYLASGWPALYVFDVDSKEMEKTNSSIMPHRTTLGKCVEVASGIMLGVYGTNCWRYNIATDSSTTNSLPGTAWSGFTYSHDCRLELGPDGYVWVTLGDDLYRIHPTTCEPELVKAGIGPHNVVFNGGDAYLYNPTTPELHGLENLLLNDNTVNIGTLRAQNLILR